MSGGRANVALCLRVCFELLEMNSEGRVILRIRQQDVWENNFSQSLQTHTNTRGHI